MENSHSVTIQISGPYNDVYGSEWFNDILNSELDQYILKERVKLLKKVKPLIDILEKEWVGTMTLTTGDSYSEILSYRHPSALAAEITLMLSDGQIQQTDVQVTKCANFELLDYTNRYLSKNGHKQTSGVSQAYQKACKNIIEYYGSYSKIARVVDPAYHCFCITSADKPLLMQSILSPVYRSNQVIEQSTSSNKMTGF
jgi:hypothetical protein